MGLFSFSLKDTLIKSYIDVVKSPPLPPRSLFLAVKEKAKGKVIQSGTYIWLIPSTIDLTLIFGPVVNIRLEILRWSTPGI
jgi:hypothetical protein